MCNSSTTSMMSILLARRAHTSFHCFGYRSLTVTHLRSNPALRRRPSRPEPAEEPEETPEELQRSLPGTVQAHRCLVLLDSLVPPSSFAARHSTPIQRELQLRLLRQGGIVNFAWFGGDPAQTNAEGQEDVASGVAYTPTGGRLALPHISSSNIDTVAQQLMEHMSDEAKLQPETTEHLDILVCTHGARDCRCGDIGGQVYEALRDEVEKRTRGWMAGEPRIRVGQVGHVGGHKYAANVLVYPHGEWFGLMKPEDAPRLVSSLITSRFRPLSGSNSVDLLPEHWRGRMGLGKDEQVALFKARAKREKERAKLFKPPKKSPGEED